MSVTKGFFADTYLDYDGERSTVSIHTTPLTAANFDAQVALQDAFVVALSEMTLGNRGNWAYGNRRLLSNTKASLTTAQRESKWLIQWHDNVTLDKGTTEIPCANSAMLDPDDRKHANIGDSGNVDAFVTAFEAVALSKLGNAITVDEITHVGRNV